jgi:hypothetical protein
MSMVWVMRRVMDDWNCVSCSTRLSQSPVTLEYEDTGLSNVTINLKYSSEMTDATINI